MTILRVAELVGHMPLLMFQLKLTVPVVKPITPLVPSDGVNMIGVPDKIDQLGKPTVGIFPVKAVVGEVIQMLCVGPVVAGVGAAST